MRRNMALTENPADQRRFRDHPTFPKMMGSATFGSSYCSRSLHRGRALARSEEEWLRSTASRRARDEKLRMRSFSCSTIVELFHLPSRVLIAMMVSSTVVVISNQWSSIHCMRFKSPRPNRPHDIEQESRFVGSRTRPQRASEERLLRQFPRDATARRWREKGFEPHRSRSKGTRHPGSSRRDLLHRAANASRGLGERDACVAPENPGESALRRFLRRGGAAANGTRWHRRRR